MGKIIMSGTITLLLVIALIVPIQGNWTSDHGLKAYIGYNTEFSSSQPFAEDLGTILSNYGFNVTITEINESIIRPMVQDPKTKLLFLDWHGTDQSIQTTTSYYLTSELQSDLANRRGLTISGILCCGSQWNIPVRWIYETRKGDINMISMRCNSAYVNYTWATGRWLASGDGEDVLYGISTTYNPIMKNMTTGRCIAAAINQSWGSYYYVEGSGQIAFGIYGFWGGNPYLRFPEYYGDVDYDFDIDITDRNAVAQYLMGRRSFTIAQKHWADVDGNGKVTIKDLAIIDSLLNDNIDKRTPAPWTP